MGFLSGLVGAVVKTAVSPIAVAKDVVNAVTGEEVDSSKKAIDSIVDDIEEALDEIT